MDHEPGAEPGRYIPKNHTLLYAKRITLVMLEKLVYDMSVVRKMSKEATAGIM